MSRLSRACLLSVFASLFLTLVAPSAARDTLTPLGATPVAGGVQFAVFSEHATRLEVWIFAGPTDTVATSTHAMTKTDVPNHVWTVTVAGAAAGTLYGLRAWGPNWTFMPGWTPGTSKIDDTGFSAHVDASGNRFNPNKLLTDPYAKAVTGEPQRVTVGGEERYDSAILGGVDDFAFVDSAGAMPKSIVVDNDAFDWTGDTAPDTDLRDTIVYEVHLRGFSRAAPDIAQADQGTYTGFAAKAPYLDSLGVNVVELLPVHEFWRFDDPVGTTTDRTNYWGYMTTQFFAPNREYLCRDHDSCSFSAGEQVAAFKQMVKDLHALGLEVWLDVVYNHTSEGGGCAGNAVRYINLRGLDNQSYYTLADDRTCYWDTTGTGNNVNASNPGARRLILDSLSYWIDQMHVDGFRFDLAYTLGRQESDGRDFNPNAQTLLDIAQLGQNEGVDMIAEAWDASGFGVGQFPSGWSEWNGWWRDNVRRFVKSDADEVGDLGQSITASWAGFNAPPESVNFITAHDGFTLNDLVSYNGKLNGAGSCNPSGSDPNSGSDTNDSWDHGGDETLRRRQIRNFASQLFVHQGVPMLLAGDELRNTQSGNNNSYMADNACGWLDWQDLQDFGDTWEYFRRLIDFRKRHDALRRTYPLSGTDNDGDGYADLGWHGVLPDAPDWSSGSRTLAFLLDGSSLETGGSDVPDLYTAYNAYWADLSFTLPTAPNGKCWYLLADTADWAEEIGNIFWDPAAVDFDSQPLLRVASVDYGLQARSTLHLLARPCTGVEESTIVTFEVSGFVTASGEEIRVVGNAPELGDGDAAAAPALWQVDTDTWRGLIVFQQSRGTEVTYNYVVVEGEQLTSEGDPVRVFNVPSGGLAEETGVWHGTCTATDVVLADLMVSDSQAYTACNSITVGPNVTVEATGELDVDAPLIIFTNGVSIAGSLSAG